MLDSTNRGTLNLTMRIAIAPPITMRITGSALATAVSNSHCPAANIDPCAREEYPSTNAAEGLYGGDDDDEPRGPHDHGTQVGMQPLKPAGEDAIQCPQKTTDERRQRQPRHQHQGQRPAAPHSGKAHERPRIIKDRLEIGQNIFQHPRQPSCYEITLPSIIDAI